MEVIQWPRELLRHLSATYFLRFRSRSAGRALSGQEQIVSSGTASWEIRLDLSRQMNSRLMKEFDGYVAAMNGRANIAEFGVCDPFRYGERVSPAQRPFSDGTWFSDGTGHMVAGSEPLIISQAANRGDTTLHVSLTNPVRPGFRVGDEFSYDYFLYRVTGSGGDGLVQFEPRLRTDIPVGAMLITDPPVIRARFASDDEGQRARELLRYGAAISLNFVEAFDR
jgi:hypothetical protein